MSRTNGRNLQIKRGNAVIAVVNTKTINFDNTPVDVTGNSDAGFVTYLSKPGTRQMSCDVSGVTNDDTLRDVAVTGSGLLAAHTIEWLSDLGAVIYSISGDFYLSSFSETGASDGAIEFTASLQSSGKFSWQPSKFFAGGTNGLWYRFADIDTLYQDTAMTVPVTADNDPVGAIVDKSGNGVNGLQSVSAKRVAFKTSPNRIDFDGTDDNIHIDFGTAFSGTVYINTDDGLLSYEINVPSGVWQLPIDARFLHSNGFREIIAVARAANESDYNLVRQYMGAEVFAPVGSIQRWFRYRSEIVSFFDYSLDVSSATIFSTSWQGCSGLVNFPLLDVSKGEAFIGTWLDCSGLVSFPLLDVRNGTSFVEAWLGCSNLVNFPANFFDNCLATDFTSAFNRTNLSQESIDSILVSINSNGTSIGTFNQSGGNAPSAVGQAAILAMRARGWTVEVTGGF